MAHGASSSMTRSDIAWISSIVMLALLERDSGENSVADAAERAPWRTRRSTCLNLLTREDLEGGAAAAAAAGDGD